MYLYVPACRCVFARQKLGVRLHPHEVDELMEFMHSMSDRDSSHVNFQLAHFHTGNLF